MNFLFGFAQAVATGFILFIFYKMVILKFCKKKTQKAFKSYVIPLLFFLVLVIIYLNLMTYGPRITLETTHIPEASETVEVPKGKGFIKKSNRVGQFDEKLND